MQTIKMKLIDAKQTTRMTTPEGGSVSMVYAAAYQPGDMILLECGEPGQL